jgi:hypothetical protein
VPAGNAGCLKASFAVYNGGMSWLGKNNRKSERIDLRIPVKITLDGQTIKGELQDFSEGGSFVSCTVYGKPGAPVRIEFELKGDFILTSQKTSWDLLRAGTPLPDSLAIDGLIKWELPRPSKGFGVMFGKLDRKTAKVVAALAGLFAKHKAP